LVSRRLSEHEEKVQNRVQEFAFTLARPVYNRVKLLWQAPARSLDVVDRHTLLHVAYQTTACGKWILAACIDERGEAHDIGVWLTQSESNETYVVDQVWSFAMQFARRANIEWRIAIAKLGSMKGTELNGAFSGVSLKCDVPDDHAAWMVHLATAVPTSQELSMMHVSLLCTEPDAPWTFIASHQMKRLGNPRRTSPKDKLGSLFLDSSASTYALFSAARMPLLSTLRCSRDLGAELSFVPEADDVAECEHLGLLPLSTSTIIRVPSQLGHTAISMLHIHLLYTIKSSNSSLELQDKEIHADITKNYHDLAVLAGCRWKMDVNPILPFHLAALEVMQIALDRGDSMTE
jgi:mediator of RNA polymerase II transcription subunit 13, fungi type